MPNEINPQEIEQPEVAVTETETTIEPIYKHKDGRIFTKSQFLSEGVTEDRINNGLSKGLITQIGDTEDPEQQFKHKDGRVFSVKDFTAQGVGADRIANGLKLGLITPIEKKNQIESTQQYQEPATGSQVGVSQSTTNIPQVDISEVDKVTATEPEETPPPIQAGPLPIPEGYDAISKTMESFDLKNRKKSKMTTSKNVMGQDITTITEEPDEEAISQSKKVDEELKGYGIDANELYNKVKDLPEDVYSIQVKRLDGTVYNKYSKENLTKMAVDSPVSFDYAVNTFKNRFALKKAANKLTEEGTPTDGAYLSELYNSLNQATSFDEWENNQVKQQELINTYLPTMEERRAALGRAKDNAAMFITPNNLDIQKAYEQSPLKGKVDISQFSALEVMKLYEPQKYEQALKFINVPLTTETEPSANISFTGNGFEYGVGAPKETQESIDAKIGKETILKTLSDQGRQYAILDLQRQNEKLVDASNKVTDTNQLQNIKTQYEDNKLRINAIKDDYKKDAERFPLTSDLKYETQVKDFLNQAEFNAAEYGVSRLGKGFENTYSSMNNVVTKLFGSDMENTINQMKGLGFKKREEADFYMPEAYQGNAPLFLTQFEKPLADKLNAITQGKDLKDLSKKQLDDMSNVLIENQNQIKTVTNPNGGKSKNFLSLATLYSNTGMLGDIASFALQAGALKGLGASDAMASAIPMWTTAQSDFYREGVEKGVQDPDGYADVHATVMFLAGLINPSLKIVKRAVGIDTKLGQMLSGISEKTWNDVVNKNSQLIGKIQNSISHTAKEATGMALTFGAGTSLAGDIINKEMYAQDITGGQMIDNAIESMKHILNSSAGILSIGAISNFKGAPMTEKSALWQLADNKSLNLTRIDEALKAGKISEDQAASRKKVVEDVSDIVNKMPNKDVNGKLMTDEQKLDYFYNLLLKKKGEEDKSVLPKPQQEKIDYATKVADYSNNLILDPKTDEELNARKQELQDALTPKFDENGKVLELPLNERIDLSAELDAIVSHLDKKENEKKPTQTTEQILANEPGAETIEVIDEAEVMRQMKPITDGMADVERQFKNEGYEIDWDYDNETQILDKNGEMVEPEDLPENLRKLAGQYEYLTSNLGEFDQKSFLKSLNESRKVVETEAEVVKPTELPEVAKVETVVEKGLEAPKELSNVSETMKALENIKTPKILDKIAVLLGGKKFLNKFRKEAKGDESTIRIQDIDDAVNNSTHHKVKIKGIEIVFSDGETLFDKLVNEGFSERESKFIIEQAQDFFPKSQLEFFTDLFKDENVEDINSIIEEEQFKRSINRSLNDLSYMRDIGEVEKRLEDYSNSKKDESFGITNKSVSFLKNLLNQVKEGESFIITEDQLSDLGISKTKPKEILHSWDIAEAYHKSKADGSNPELVKAVEDLIGKKTVTEKSEVVPAKKRGRPKKEKEEKAFTIASINRVEARKAYDHVYSLDVPTDANGIVMHWLSMGGKINPESFTEDVMGYRRSRGAAKKMMPSEARTSEFTDNKSKLTIDGAAHQLWETLPYEVRDIVDATEVRDALVDVLGSYSKRIDVAKDFILQYDPEEAVRRFYEKEIGENREEYESERAELEDWYNERTGEDFDLMLDDNFVNKLIKEYEQEYPKQVKGGVEEITQGEKGGGPEKISGGENVPEEKPKSIADKLRSLKSDKGKAYDATIGLPIAIWDGSLEIIAKSIEAGEDIADAIKKGIDYINKNYKDKWDLDKYKTKVNEQFKAKSQQEPQRYGVWAKRYKDFVRDKNGNYYPLKTDLPNGFRITPNYENNEGEGVLYDDGGYRIMEGNVWEIEDLLKESYPTGTPEIKDGTNLDLYSNINNFTLKQFETILNNLDPQGDWENMVKEVDGQPNEYAAKKLETKLLAESRAKLKEFVIDMLKSDKADEYIGFDIPKDGLGKTEIPKQKNIDNFTANEGNKVVNNQGEPITVYHGSDKQFNEFKNEGLGIFFTSDKETAEGYRKKYGEEKGNLYESNINIKNPVIIDAKGKKWDDIEVETNTMNPEKIKLSTNKILETIRGLRYPEIIHNLTGEKIKPDGLIIKNVIDPLKGQGKPIDIYVVFDNNQIKKAEITEQKGGEVNLTAEPKTDAERKTFADKLRELKSAKGKAYESILGIPVAIWDGALELAAKTAETTEDIAKIIKAGIDHIKESDWYKNLSSTEKQKTEKDFSSKMKSLLGIEEPTKVTIETEHPFLYEGTDEKRVAGLMKNMLEAENVSDETKRLLKKGGVEYKTASNAEAEIIANDVIKSFGDKDALKIAEGKDMHPSVRSAIYAKLIDNAFKDEMNAKTEEAKLEAAQRQAELSIKYSKELTAGGQFTAYAGHFYRTSPLAFVFRENSEREKRASDWYSDKKETYQEIFERIKDIAEVKEAIAKEVESALKEERKARREKRDKNIDQFFDSAKIKGGIYSTIIPPTVWNGAMEGLKKAVKAGDRIADAVQRAIDEISKSIGDSWDKEKFRKDFENKLSDIADGGKKEKTEAEILEGFKKRKEELERRIRENDFSAEEYKEKKTLSEKVKLAKEEYEEVKKAYDETKKNSPEWQDKKVKQFLERFKKKFPGLTEEQKRKVVIKSIKRIAESGSLSEAEFRDIVTEALGIKPLTDVQVKEIEGLVNKINAVTEAQQKMIKDPTEANIKAYEKAKEDGMKAALDLYTFVSPKSDIVRNFKSIVTGSFLGVFSNILNIGSNIINQPLVRFPIAAIKQLSEGTLYGMSVLGNKFGLSNIYEPTSNLWEAQKGYFEGLGKGFKRGWFNFKTGTQEKDYFGKTTFYSNLNPKQAVKDIKGWWKGDQYYTKKELADRALRATIGWQPDFILKSMSFGDKPFRWAAEYSKARQIAKMELKLKNENEVRAFLADPKEYSKKIFLERKDTEAIAEKKAQEIEDRVMDAGNKAVFEVDTILSWMSKKMDSWFTSEKDDSTLSRYAKGIGAVLKAAQLPFIRIPAYIYWTTYKIINPELSLAQSIYHLSESAVYKKRGDEAKMRKSLEEAKDNAAMFAYGTGIAVAAASLVSGGYVRPSNDDETTAREAAGERTFGKSGVFNMGRMMGTKDWWVDLKWFGPLGGALNVRSKIFNARKKEALKGKQEDITFWDDKLDKLTEGAAEGLNNLIFNNAARTVNALKSPQDAGKEWVTYNANTLQNVFTGATYAQLSKAMLPYQANTKADGTLEQINKNTKTRNVLYRLAVGMPKAKVSIWGDPIKQNNTLGGIMANVLGFEQGSPNQFGAIIFDDYQRTMNDKFFPMPEDYNITVNDEKVKLTEAEKYDLDEFIGKARKEMVGPFVYDLVATNAYNLETPGANPKVYSQLKDDEKVEALQWAYKAARDSGYLRFTEKYPKYKVADITPEKIIKQEFKEARKEIFGAEVIMKPPK